MGYKDEISRPVVTSWYTFSSCQFAKKSWVNHKNVNEDKGVYTKGDFLRVWCRHDGDWCCIETDPDDCAIKADHDKE